MFPHTGQRRTCRAASARCIEVGVGIHPELTGRENIIHLRHAARSAAAARSPSEFDEIVAFAELEDAIDRQVKFYSSG